ncbi:rhomboid family intramembrane serine protease [Chondromyces apiculatus]|uniref:Rhomboid family serine protease n=1 Tax=Chondromyces apiculatus DSM 436 TaxID=1192034 RepID=A0A017T3U8_9BACT|nr:rhomboid family intramembrane serine protease [Chondromyces apiculatus]EYF03918.1 rhomboid family serine protease [Chondromyces apiculatus DSM 436]
MLPIRDHLPARRAPVVTYVLIAVNVLVFLWMRAVIAVGYPPHHLLMGYGLVPLRLHQDPLGAGWTVLSSMFMHDPSGWLHLGGNMLFLWIFGDNVEDALGRLRYASFYVLAGLAAAAAQFFIDPTSRVPMVGASGAISGVLAAYGSLYPRAPVTVLNPVLPLWFIFGLSFELPAWAVILEYFTVNLLNALGSVGAEGGGVAFFAHLGGFIGGLFLIRWFMVGRTRREHEPWSRWRSPPRRPPTRWQTR